MSWKGYLSVQKKDGTHIETVTTVSPIIDESKTVISYINMQRDVTAEAQLERQLRQTQKIQAIGTLNVGLENIDLDEVAAKKYLELKAGPYTRLSVRDTGHGMDPRVIERIFEPFFTTKKQPEGSGMGLSVVHGIVKNHGGSISVHSEPGKGSSFRILFPRVEQSVKEKPVYAVPPPNGKEKILLVDDELIVGEVGKEMLETLGYHVVFKTDGVQALETFRNDPGRFDLVITDQTMPGLTGYELSKELIGCRSDIPIILCTGFSDVMTSDKAKAAGGKEFVFKPYAIRDIAEVVHKVLKQPA